MSIIFDSLIPLSMTLESSIELIDGGPDSKSGDDNGNNSIFTIKDPSSGVSGYGVPTSIFTPAITSVSPIFTLADPSADFDETPVSIFISLYSSSFLLSTLVFFSSKDNRYFLFMSFIFPLHTFPLMLFFVFHIYLCMLF